MYALDGEQFPLTDAEANHLLALAPRLKGCLPLSGSGAHGRGSSADRAVARAGRRIRSSHCGGSVPTSLFCDYLYTRITRWRTHKQPNLWPWRDVIAGGQASTGYLQGILIENYHYVHAAAIRQSPLLSHAASPAIFDLVRDFVAGEAAHEGYFLETLIRWGLPAADVQQATPLTSTAEFIAFHSRVHRLAISPRPSVHSRLSRRLSDPGSRTPGLRARRRPLPGLGNHLRHRPGSPGARSPHIRDDVGSGHSQLFRAAALETAPAALPLETATSALSSARTVFQATRLWQRDIYEHYQQGGGNLGRTSL